MAQVAYAETSSSWLFDVTKQEPQLITPATPTPYELKELSDIDNQKDLRYLVPGIQYYRSCPSGQDPVNVIKEALAKALVPYYPFAGRLREKEDGKLVVECNGDGIMFIEADADITLLELGEPLYPPLACIEDLLYDFSNIDSFLDYPLLIIQVTRLKCGGFIFAHRINHAFADAFGLSQFMLVVAELARGAEILSTVQPVWERHLLQARDPPHVTCVHPEYDAAQEVEPYDSDVTHASFLFGSKEIDSLRRLLPEHLKSSTTVEILTAFIWRSRTVALQFNPNDEVRLRFNVDARTKFSPPIPEGYYGNAYATPMAISTANDLTTKPLEYTLSLIKNVKDNIGEEYMKSLIDFLVVNDGPRSHKGPCHCVISDVSQVGLDQWDFGWGKPVFGGPIDQWEFGMAKAIFGRPLHPGVLQDRRADYGGPAKFWIGESPRGFGIYFMASKNSAGESCIMVPMYLPALAMNRFVDELDECLSP